jgi:hypothetical protein
MEACVGPTSAAFLKWLAPIIASFFPWPALIALLLLLGPFRRSLSSFVSGFAELPRAVTAIQLAGMKINLDPSKAKELLSISSEVVFSDFDRMVDREVEKLKVWSKFESVIEKALKPLLDTTLLNADDPYLFRATLHIADTLQPESLYQLIEYYPQGPFAKARGRRLSIRFGAIGKAWRQQRSEYSPVVSTDREVLIRDWGMTASEAEKAGRDRQTFLAVIIVDASKIPLAIFYMDAKPARLLGSKDSNEISDKILAACASSKLTDALVSLRTKMEEAARPRAS